MLTVVSSDRSPWRIFGVNTESMPGAADDSRSDSHPNMKKVLFFPSYTFGIHTGPLAFTPNWF